MSETYEEAARPLIAALEDFEGVSVDQAVYGKLDAAYREAVSLTQALTLRNPLEALRDFVRLDVEPDTMRAMRSLTAMVAGVGGQCRIDPPPLSLAAVTDARGNLIYRCNHAPAHEWDMSGKRIK